MKRREEGGKLIFEALPKTQFLRLYFVRYISTLSTCEELIRHLSQIFKNSDRHIDSLRSIIEAMATKSHK